MVSFVIFIFSRGYFLEMPQMLMYKPRVLKILYLNCHLIKIFKKHPNYRVLDNSTWKTFAHHPPSIPSSHSIQFGKDKYFLIIYLCIWQTALVAGIRGSGGLGGLAH